MTKLFGLDIDKIVNSAIVSAGNVRKGTLTKIIPGTRGTNPTAGTNSSTTTHTFNGFIERKSVRRSGAVASANMSVLSILGASVNPTAKPSVNDKALLDGTTYTLVELLEVDPAEALYEFGVEG